MDISELVKLLGIIVVIVGFTLKLDSILTILIAAVTTGRDCRAMDSDCVFADAW